MEPTDRLTVTLTAQEWNTLMTVMGEAPFKLVAPLVQQIQGQCMAQQHAQRHLMNGPVPNGFGQPGPFPRVVEPEQPAG